MNPLIAGLILIWANIINAEEFAEGYIHRALRYLETFGINSYMAFGFLCASIALVFYFVWRCIMRGVNATPANAAVAPEPPVVAIVEGADGNPLPVMRVNSGGNVERSVPPERNADGSVPRRMVQVDIGNNSVAFQEVPPPRAPDDFDDLDDPPPASRTRSAARKGKK